MDMSSTNCHYCGVLVFTKYMHRHERYCRLNPNRDATFSCGYCMKVFSRHGNLRAHIAKKHEPDGPQYTLDDYQFEPELYRVSVEEKMSPKHNSFQRVFNIEFTKRGLQKAAKGHLMEMLQTVINKELRKLRNKDWIGQLAIDSAGLDYPISSAVRKLGRLDVNMIMERAERTEQSEPIIDLNENNPFIRVSLYVREL